MERLRTKSKTWFDDEILFVDKTTGDIHLKEGVRRLKYSPNYNSQENEKYINNEIISQENFSKLVDKLGIRERLDQE